ncbi:MAG: DUF4129 domain-containing protein [Planctomycetota bacterium]|nr:MAG: DUF4129 domain-containing protein [Planctomycetota bacterium]
MIAQKNRARSAAVWLLLAAGSMCAMPAPAAGHQAEDPAVEQGREAFGDATFPWYNSESDSLEPIEFWNPPKWDSPVDLGSVLQILFWIGITVLVIVLVVLIYRFTRDQTSRELSVALQRTSDEILAADQVEALGFLAERPRDDLLGRARRYYEEGNYAEAIIYLFSYQLLQLDKFALIRLAKGKTNRQYLREAGRVPPLGGSLERTMLAFEHVFFGQRGLDRAGFEACWNALPDFEQQLRATS